jgi:hypothetical protein
MMQSSGSKDNPEMRGSGVVQAIYGNKNDVKEENEEEKEIEMPLMNRSSSSKDDIDMKGSGILQALNGSKVTTEEDDVCI